MTDGAWADCVARSEMDSAHAAGRVWPLVGGSLHGGPRCEDSNRRRRRALVRLGACPTRRGGHAAGHYDAPADSRAGRQGQASRHNLAARRRLRGHVPISLRVIRNGIARLFFGPRRSADCALPVVARRCSGFKVFHIGGRIREAWLYEFGYGWITRFGRCPGRCGRRARKSGLARRSFPARGAARSLQLPCLTTRNRHGVNSSPGSMR